MARRAGLEGVAASILAMLTHTKPQDAGLFSPNEVYFRFEPGKVYSVKSWWLLAPPVAALAVVFWFGLWEVFRVVWGMGHAERVAMTMRTEVWARAVQMVTVQYRIIVAFALAFAATIPLRQRFDEYRRFANGRDMARESSKPAAPSNVGAGGGLAPIRFD